MKADQFEELEAQASAALQVTIATAKHAKVYARAAQYRALAELGQTVAARHSNLVRNISMFKANSPDTLDV